MGALLPGSTTLGDLVGQALKDCGAWGVGQTPLAEDLVDAWARLQWMLQEWERKRWLVYHLVTYLKVSTGAQGYTVGPGGAIDTGAGTSVRPNKLESAFLRQITQANPNQIDYPLKLLQSMEDYNTIAIKGLTSFPSVAFYDSAWPLGKLYFWPIPSANIYSLGITVMEQLPVAFATQASPVVLPYEYYSAILYNLALRLRPKYGIPTPPGDMILQLAKDSLNAIRNSNAQIAELGMPDGLSRPGIYNIFSDRNY